MAPRRRLTRAAAWRGGSGGPIAGPAIRRDFFNSPRVHWMRSALAHAPKGQQTMVAAALRQAFLQPDQGSARRVWRQMADQFRPHPPRPWPRPLRGRMIRLRRIMAQARQPHGRERARLIAARSRLAYLGFSAQHRAKLHSTDELDKGLVRGGWSGGRGPERPPRVWRRHAPTGSRRWSTTRRSGSPNWPKPARPSGLHGAMLLRHGRPRGEQRGSGWKPRRVA